MVARLISQSAPVRYFMKKDNLITFNSEDYISDIRGTLAKIRHRDFPVLDRDGHYCGMLSRRSLLAMDNKKLIMVDHNEMSQAVDGIDEAEILEIIDHHRIGSLETTLPVYFRNQPVGCTATIIYEMYQENDVEVEPAIAGLLCSAIISDTLMFRSPTCTAKDKKTAEILAQIAGIDIQDHAEKMFRAGSSLADKTPEEIFYQDFKTFSINDVSFGVGQINAMTREELAEIKERIKPYMEASLGKMSVNMAFFMLTDIIGESTELLFVGNNAEELIENAFNVSLEGDSFRLDGVISRKKQLIPSLMSTIQQ